MEPLQLSLTEGAKGLGVTRNTLSRVTNGRNGIPAEMTIRLANQRTFVAHGPEGISS